MSRDQTKLVIVLLSLLVATQHIFVQLSRQAPKRCFLAELSPDKTLDAKFAILRRDNQQCKISFMIQIKDDEDKVKQNVHYHEYFCSQTKMNEQYTVKHTSEHLDYHGIYELCVQALDLRIQKLEVELFMGERLNPMIYHQSETEIPLVESAELYELEGNVHTIKKTLVRIQKKAEESKQLGDLFDLQVDKVLSTGKKITIAHIVILIVFGAIWVYLVMQLKRSN